VNALLVMLLAAQAGPAAPPTTPARRLGSMAGLENVAEVAPGFYRGGAPSAAGLDSIKSLGIKTVVNLRHYHGTTEEQGCRERGIDYVRIVLESSDAPSDEDVRLFLRVVTDPARRPVYVHCWRGKDRTGVMVAAYRMAVQGWPRDAALREMDDFGFYRGWRDLRGYVEGLAARTHAVWPLPTGETR
jgi:protein tyrosine/serine phosphatase